MDDMSRHGFCDLCQKLHEDSSYKSYPELSTDWGDDSKQCARTDRQLDLLILVTDLKFIVCFCFCVFGLCVLSKKKNTLRQ